MALDGTRTLAFAFQVAGALCLALAGCSSSHGADRDAGRDGGADSGRSGDAGGPADAGADGGAADARADGAHWSACSRNTACVVAPESCCGSCGAATPDDMVGVNDARLSKQRAEACEASEGCPGCFAMQDPHLVATCDGTTCRALDLRAHEATECSGDSGCVLSVGECSRCEDVPPAEVIAVSSTERVSEILCDEDAPPPPCAPTFPDHLEAYCDGGRCAVRDTSSGG